MARILCMDYGKVRTGLAVTDPMCIAIKGLPTVATPNLRAFLHEYLQREEIRMVVIGYPTHADDTPTYLSKEIDKLIDWIKEQNAHIHIECVDEAFTSVEARDQLRKIGVPKKKREKKEKVDEMSAILILQQYLMGNN